ncbi:unnamed protein product [Urochloa decumbens]|uniref:Saposin B-type domain-containing protein n=1 Tax=Urochloa decumbens TaxID=240449 RepID=A0ABC9HEN7_9POAL
MGLRASFLLFVLLVASWGAAHAHASQDRKLGKVHVSHGSGSPLCSPCEKFANEAVSYLNQKQTQDKIIAFLHDACSQTFSLEQKCAELMDSYAALLFAKITEIKPEEFCAHYGLCRNIDLLSVKSESTCVFCHHLVDEVMSKLKDPDAECKRLVLQYIPLILVNGEKFLEKNDLCALVQACPASQKRTVSWFLDGELVSDA